MRSEKYQALHFLSNPCECCINSFEVFWWKWYRTPIRGNSNYFSQYYTWKIDLQNLVTWSKIIWISSFGVILTRKAQGINWCFREDLIRWEFDIFTTLSIFIFKIFLNLRNSWNSVKHENRLKKFVYCPG